MTSRKGILVISILFIANHAVLVSASPTTDESLIHERQDFKGLANRLQVGAQNLVKGVGNLVVGVLGAIDNPDLSSQINEAAKKTTNEDETTLPEYEEEETTPRTIKRTTKKRFRTTTTTIAPEEEEQEEPTSLAPKTTRRRFTHKFRSTTTTAIPEEESAPSENAPVDSSAQENPASPDKETPGASPDKETPVASPDKETPAEASNQETSGAASNQQTPASSSGKETLTGASNNKIPVDSPNKETSAGSSNNIVPPSKEAPAPIPTVVQQPIQIPTGQQISPTYILTPQFPQFQGGVPQFVVLSTSDLQQLFHPIHQRPVLSKLPGVSKPQKLIQNVETVSTASPAASPEVPLAAIEPLKEAPIPAAGISSNNAPGQPLFIRRPAPVQNAEVEASTWRSTTTVRSTTTLPPQSTKIHTLAKYRLSRRPIIRGTNRPAVTPLGFIKRPANEIRETPVRHRPAVVSGEVSPGITGYPHPPLFINRRPLGGGEDRGPTEEPQVEEIFTEGVEEVTETTEEAEESELSETENETNKRK